METIQEVIPFAKEMLNAGSKGSMKVYLVGSTFAVLGVMSGVVEAVCSLFPDNGPYEEDQLREELITEQTQTLETETVVPEMEDELASETEAKAKELATVRQRRMSFRAHAS
ncbi:G0/G1 switch protein 2 [Chanos chanos]|uniref:G0/G1 switch protein 2 n=1 Tax=Chanos chanos TaxID=29144 RepID=A0A6J2UWJ8_CHACN|nr:G0/G1 switch protein 2 [Chanos chanos]